MMVASSSRPRLSRTLNRPRRSRGLSILSDQRPDCQHRMYPRDFRSRHDPANKLIVVGVIRRKRSQSRRALLALESGQFALDADLANSAR